MAKSINDRVKDSFEKDDREDISKYLDWTRSTLLDYSQSNRRTATFLIIVVAIFELVAYSRNASISIGSFAISRGTVILDFMPALAAYFFLQVIADWGKVNQLTKVLKATFQAWSKKAEENDLDVFLLGSVPLYWDPQSGYTKATNIYPADRVQTVATNTTMVVILLGILAFEAQAYYVLFVTSGSRLTLWIISLCITFFCLIMGWIMALADSDTK
jgi:hypothetical protein